MCLQLTSESVSFRFKAASIFSFHQHTWNTARRALNRGESSEMEYQRRSRHFDTHVILINSLPPSSSQQILSCAMAGRAPPPHAGSMHNHTQRSFKPSVDTNKNTRPYGQSKTDGVKASDGVESFKYAVGSSSNPGARTPPVQAAEERPQKSTVRKQAQQAPQKLQGVNNLLNPETMHQLGRSSPQPPTASDIVHTAADASRSAYGPVQTKAYENMPTLRKNFLTDIVEATEPPTSSPPEYDERRHNSVHKAANKPTLPTSASAKVSSATLARQQTEDDLSARSNALSSLPSHAQVMASPSRPVKKPTYAPSDTPGAKQRERAATEGLSTERTSPSSDSNLPLRDTNPFARKKHILQKSLSRPTSPLPPASRSFRASEAPLSPRLRPTSHLATTSSILGGKKRSAASLISSVQAALAGTSNDSPVHDEQPSAKRARIQYHNNPTVLTRQPDSAPQTRSSVPMKDSTETGKQATPHASQRQRPSGVYGSRGNAASRGTAPQTRPMPMRNLPSTVPVEASKHHEAIGSNSGDSTLGTTNVVSQRSDVFGALATRLGSSPESSMHTSPTSIPPELDPVFMDLLQWVRNESSIGELQSADLVFLRSTSSSV